MIHVRNVRENDNRIACIHRNFPAGVAVIKSGGYIPSCDYGVPADVSWPDFVQYSRLLAQATGWL